MLNQVLQVVLVLSVSVVKDSVVHLRPHGGGHSTRLVLASELGSCCKCSTTTDLMGSHPEQLTPYTQSDGALKLYLV